MPAQNRKVAQLLEGMRTNAGFYEKVKAFLAANPAALTATLAAPAPL